MKGLLHQQKAEAVRFFLVPFHDLKAITHLPGRGINIHPEGFQGGARHQRVPAFGLGVLAGFTQIAWGRREGKGLVKSGEENFSLQSEHLFVDFSRPAKPFLRIAKFFCQVVEETGAVFPKKSFALTH